MRVFDCPIYVLKFNHHRFLKEQLLQQISDSNFEEKKVDGEFVKTDYYIQNKNQKYKNTFSFTFNDEFRGFFKTIDYDVDFKNYETWFQQYDTSGFITWHRHAKSSWNLVYYLELPEGCPATEFKDLITGEYFSVNAHEGDVVIFPSILLHRSPENDSEGRKTVIVCNID